MPCANYCTHKHKHIRHFHHHAHSSVCCAQRAHTWHEWRTIHVALTPPTIIMTIYVPLVCCAVMCCVVLCERSGFPPVLVTYLTPSRTSFHISWIMSRPHAKHILISLYTSSHSKWNLGNDKSHTLSLLVSMKIYILPDCCSCHYYSGLYSLELLQSSLLLLF